MISVVLEGNMQTNIVYYKSSTNMKEILNNSVDLIVTSPPYFNIKDYSKDGYQKKKISNSQIDDVGAINNYNEYILKLLSVWKECHRVLRPNGKLIINVPLMPIPKKNMNTHYTRHIFDLQSDIQHSILHNTKFYLFDLYIWHRKTSTKKLMFGSYPYPRNFYAQNTTEFITVYVKDGKSNKWVSNEIKEQSKLTEKEWVEYTTQIWDIASPNKGDIAFGKHPAIMPEEIVNRCVRLFSMVNDVVLDPFAGSGTTLRVAKRLGRKYIGYELYKNYKEVIDMKVEGELF